MSANLHMALLVDKIDGKIKSTWTEVPRKEPEKGQVLIDVHYSSVNYKDALGVTGKGRIYKKFPIVGGIDCSGLVELSNDERFQKGDLVLVTGCGLGESKDGGYQQKVTVPADWVVPLPKGLDLAEVMKLGTAGFTAALSLWRMEQNGQSPQQGAILVTGASGGVGQCAVNLLHKRGYEVVAVSAKKEQHDLLKEIGAHTVLTPDELPKEAKPLDSALWAGAIDNIGGEVLANIVSRINLWGNIACVGLAGGPNLQTTVMPLILRGVSLLGVSSANAPMPLRKKIWSLLAEDWRLDQLDHIVQSEIALSQALPFFEKMIDRQTFGRHIINCKK